MVQFKKLFTEKLLVLTAMRSLLWHIKSTISDSEDVKEVKDRIRIFILPEVERFLNSFRREFIILEQRIKPILDYFDNVREAVKITNDRFNDFETFIKLDNDTKITNIEKMLNLILEENIKDFNELYEKSTKK